ncbi:MAG: hypothetical protein M3Y87_29650 [Myxococcota bacterium]|nr:hypothetical protein [Myxococcota bacterium]
MKRFVAIALLALAACHGTPAPTVRRPLARRAVRGDSPAFAVWPVHIESVEDAVALFAGGAPCVRRRDGQLLCAHQDPEATQRDQVQRFLRFARAHATIGERAAIERELELVRRGAARDDVRAGRLTTWDRSPTPFDPPVHVEASETLHVGVAVEGGCAVVDGGHAITCWGEHGGGGVTRVEVPPGERASEVAVSAERDRLSCSSAVCGAPHACARLVSGRVACWGWNFVGQLGDGTRDDARAPVLVDGIGDATAIAVGMHHSCALHADGTVSCWGYNLAGQLGDGSDVTRARPVRVVGVTDAVAIAAGEMHGCAVRVDGRLVCWGDARRYGIREDDDGPAAAMPRMLESPEPLVEAIAGSECTCARGSSGRVYCGGSY